MTSLSLLSFRHKGNMRAMHSMQGSIAVMAAVALYVVMMLGVVAWAGIQQGADHALVGRLVENAAYDASLRTNDTALVTGTPALACLDASCAPATCPQALARDPHGTTAQGQACLSLRQGLDQDYGGANGRLDIAATVAATRVWVLAPGDRDPEDPGRIYHYPTACVSTGATIGVLARGGLSFSYHFHACGQAVYR